MKDTLKTLELLEEHIDRLTENGIYEIERDLLLERLRGVYATVVATDALAEEERVLDALMGIGISSPIMPAEDEPEIEIERIFAEEDDEEELPEEPVVVFEESETAEEVTEIENEVEESIEDSAASQEDVSEEVVEEQEEPSLCAMYGCPPAEFEQVVPGAELIAEEDEINHEAVLSLYDDDEEEVECEKDQQEELLEAEDGDTLEEQLSENLVEEEADNKEEDEESLFEDVKEAVAAAEIMKTVLGDTLATEQSTLADNLAEQVLDVSTASTARLSLRQTIAINDKYILMRDLFAGNNDYYEMAIDRLDSFDNLDEAMLYIYDNFHWNPNCEGARLLMELLARKLF